ncbi:MAG: SCO family protein [Alicyclobacillus herbarius]|uniref:SCO family protein n=1 Tax=Alicyclobacillus herbarius TaxID=122960 RepID=UPI002354233B|nr:SCO family protein [Alicyclobacillus herbarius]MCL6631128.1 SCO family protein [Alicyclobacillus herbarius]
MPTQAKSRVVGITSAIVIAVLLVGGWSWYRAQSAVQKEQKYRQLMALSTLDPAVQAPNFKLTDQNGKTVSLSSLRGKVVILEFMDPKCTDICPVVSQEVRRANQLLGNQSSEVEFLAVNVNQYHESQKDILGFSKEQGLNKLSNWHFLTGSTPALQAVWKAYGIAVIPNRTGDVEHSSFMYFISKDGTEKYVANPDNAKATIPEWSQGISYVAQKLM